MDLSPQDWHDREKVNRAVRQEMLAEAVRNTQYLTQESLVSSLARYVQVDDLKLPRELFLRKVLDRIVNDLSAPIAVPRTSQGPGLAAQQCEREGAFRRATFRVSAAKHSH
jgi:hypothetical protein